MVKTEKVIKAKGKTKVKAVRNSGKHERMYKKIQGFTGSTMNICIITIMNYILILNLET